jgi:hypothetical protein
MGGQLSVVNRRRVFAAFGLASLGLFIHSPQPVLSASGAYYLDPKAAPFNAIGDGSHDDGPAIQACWTAAQGGAYGTPNTALDVQFEPGLYLTNQPLYLPTYIVARGTGGGFGTSIQAGPSFPAGGRLVTLGDAASNTAVFAARLENISLDCAGVPGSVGLYGEKMNEMCGMRGGNIIDYMAAGAYFIAPGNGKNGSYNFLLSDLQIFAAATAINSDAIVILNTGAPVCDGHLFRITVTSAAAVNQHAGVSVIGLNAANPAILWAEDVHTEQHDHGILFGDYGGGHILGMRQEPSVLYSVTISPKSYPVLCGNISGAINDLRYGVVKPGPTALYASEIVAPVATPTATAIPTAKATPAPVPAKHAIFLPKVIG